MILHFIALGLLAEPIDDKQLKQNCLPRLPKCSDACIAFGAGCTVIIFNAGEHKNQISAPRATPAFNMAPHPRHLSGDIGREGANTGSAYTHISTGKLEIGHISTGNGQLWPDFHLKYAQKSISSWSYYSFNI